MVLQAVHIELSRLDNISYDSLHIYLKLFSVTDGNQLRLVKSKMLSMIIPSVRHLLATVTSGTHLGVLRG